jgi:hypothetical protein
MPKTAEESISGELYMENTLNTATVRYLNFGRAEKKQKILYFTRAI